MTTFTRKQRVTDYSKFEELATELKLTANELAREIGYSSSPASKWKEQNEVPAVAYMAALGLRKLKAAKPAATSTMYCVKVPVSKKHVIISLFDAMDVQYLELDV